MKRSPSPLPPVRDHLLLAEIEIEEAVGNFFELLDLGSTPDSPPELFSSKLTFQGESHDDEEAGELLVEEELGATTLTFYSVSDLGEILAVARFAAYDETGNILAVTEDLYQNSTEELCRLDRETRECIESGIDVSVMSHHDLDEFPYISDIINS